MSNSNNAMQVVTGGMEVQDGVKHFFALLKTYLVNFVKHKKEETFTCLPGLQTVCIQA
jgi:hypothetical protein